VNSDFLRPLGDTIKPLAWTLAKDKKEPAAALLFTADNRTAAIMPMHIDGGTDRAIALAKERLEKTAALPAPALPAPAPETAYWLETCGDRPRLTAGTPVRRKSGSG
jgi:hypothetical protein